MYAILSTLPVTSALGRLPMPPMAHWWRIRRERRQLLELTDHMLRDVGLTRAEARREAARPFWDVPARWWAGVSPGGRQAGCKQAGAHSSRPWASRRACSAPACGAPVASAKT
jgi:uncharacterized protein YjiS (DUF1127 family)